MATASQVKSGLDEISTVIRSQRAAVEKVIANAGLASTALGALPTTYADVLATIDGYGTSNAFEALAKAELAKLTTEFTALKGVADAIAGATL